MRTTIPDYVMSEEQFHARPEEGTRQQAGKSNKETEALGKPRSRTAVTEAKCDNGEAAKKALAAQIGLNQKDGNGLRGN